MRKQKGLLGLKFRLYTKVDVENGAILKTIGGRCPFLDRDGLCQLQKKNDKRLIADVCNLYPRRSITYGDFCEVTLELSCVHAAELFLEDLHLHSFVEQKETIDQTTPYYAVMNNAPDFLEHLMKDRDRILSYIWAEDKDARIQDFFRKMKDILEYAYAKQSYYGKDDASAAQRVQLPIGVGEHNRIIEEGLKELNGDFIFRISAMNSIVYQRLTFTCTKNRNRVVYDLIERYKKLFGNLYENQADEYWMHCIEKLYETHPNIKRIIRAYYSYLLQQTYCYIYETYYFIGPILLATMSTQFVLLFLVVAFMDEQSLENSDIARIIAGTERALRHSKTTEQEILELFRSELK